MTTEDHTRGPVPCDQVGMFVDGALDPDQAEAFRQHLVQCARCQSEMHALMQLAGLAEEASRASVPVAGKVTVPPAYMLRKRISRGAFAGGAVLAALVVGVVMLKQRRATEDVPTLLASLDVRSVSGWPRRPVAPRHDHRRPQPFPTRRFSRGSGRPGWRWPGTRYSPRRWSRW